MLFVSAIFLEETLAAVNMLVGVAGSTSKLITAVDVTAVAVIGFPVTVVAFVLAMAMKKYRIKS